jgi:hypothetical protein
MMFNPYGPSMVDQYGQDASNGLGLGHLLARFNFRPQIGGGMPPMQLPAMHTGGLDPAYQMQPPMRTGGGLQPMPQGMPPNALTGGGMAPQQTFAPQTGGAGQMQQMPQNRLGGFGGGYNFGMGGLLR